MIGSCYEDASGRCFVGIAKSSWGISVLKTEMYRLRLRVWWAEGVGDKISVCYVSCSTCGEGKQSRQRLPYAFVGVARLNIRLVAVFRAYQRYWNAVIAMIRTTRTEKR